MLIADKFLMWHFCLTIVTNKLLSVALGQEDPQLLPIEIYLSVWYPKTIQQNISVWLWHSKIGLVNYRFVLDHGGRLSMPQLPGKRARSRISRVSERKLWPWPASRGPQILKPERISKSDQIGCIKGQYVLPATIHVTKFTEHLLNSAQQTNLSVLWLKSNRVNSMTSQTKI